MSQTTINCLIFKNPSGFKTILSLRKKESAIGLKMILNLFYKNLN